MLLVNVCPGVTTCTRPVVAPVGTVAVISVGAVTLNVAATPLNVTLVAPLRLDPKIRTCPPTFPLVGTSVTNGASPVATLNTEPSPDVPPHTPPQVPP